MDINKDLTVLVCCHKQDFFHQGPGFLPIQVGKAISNVDLGIQGDDTGDNISASNPNFCELTAQYWYWKNGNHTKYVGLNHYRRYFDFNHNIEKGRAVKNFSEKNLSSSLFDIPDLDETFKDTDIIVACPRVLSRSLEGHYKKCHVQEDLAFTKSVIKSKYPEYLTAFESYIEQNNKFVPYNMFLTKYEIFDDYSKWIFEVLNEVKKHIRLSTDPMQKRVFGFLAERLLNVYIIKNNLRVKHLPIIKIDSKKNEWFITTQLLKFRKNLKFSLFGKKPFKR